MSTVGKKDIEVEQLYEQVQEMWTQEQRDETEIVQLHAKRKTVLPHMRNRQRKEVDLDELRTHSMISVQIINMTSDKVTLLRSFL